MPGQCAKPSSISVQISAKSVYLVFRRPPIQPQSCYRILTIDKAFFDSFEYQRFACSHNNQILTVDLALTFCNYEIKATAIDLVGSLSIQILNEELSRWR